MPIVTKGLTSANSGRSLSSQSHSRGLRKKPQHMLAMTTPIRTHNENLSKNTQENSWLNSFIVKKAATEKSIFEEGEYK